ncbi:RNA polymerase factor sigma-54 [Candidatus Viadribacter manganicus]|uniref:RNA polymerase sigma-54 factor n=1 Tax=Candidatus Viadribacter manganicus TaxID=1759059 RepID=A0A1B1AHD6_9PROT|nr:RNA polymerase factor sigma-54 [Candidatus Viadribacter manganicus]ANP45951.1 RNA polymerase sigma-54 factor [Candidatus Viadribacter manganicus]
MAMTPRLEMRQGQALVMTPQLQQAIKLLQLSNVELQEFVEGELERNPLLEREEGSAEAKKNEDGGDAQALEFDSGMAPAEAALDVSVADIAPDLSAGELAEAGAAPLQDWSKASSGKSFDDMPGLEETLASDKTLAEHLDAQLTEAGLTPIERMIGGVLIDAVDDWGYMRADVLDIAHRIGADDAAVLKVLQVMQGFEPTGVMARDIPECLTLQLKERGRFDPAMEALVTNLDLLAKGHFERLMTLCGVDREDLSDMIAEVRALTPKPGAGFGGGAVHSVAPDVYVKQTPDGMWLVELNTDTMPRVLMNQRYYATVSKTAKREEDKQFLTECAANASWLVKSLDQRAKTILKVAREIVRQQDGFFAHGVAHLRPLNLKTVAAAIEMHESTVSRVTSNKYLSCARGVFELKYFFTASINAADGGESHSAEAVRYQIKGLIDGETPVEILSDDRIVEILREKGIDIARRTVAKYRESLRIPSSVERKRKLAHGL